MWTLCEDEKSISNGAGTLRFHRHADALRALLALSWQHQCGREVAGVDDAVTALDSVAFAGWRSVSEAVRS